jgi:hypothetical protein
VWDMEEKEEEEENTCEPTLPIPVKGSQQE